MKCIHEILRLEYQSRAARTSPFKAFSVNHERQEQRTFFRQNGNLVLTQQPLIPDRKLLGELHESFDFCFKGNFSTGIYPHEWYFFECILCRYCSLEKQRFLFVVAQIIP